MIRTSAVSLSKRTTCFAGRKRDARHLVLPSSSSLSTLSIGGRRAHLSNGIIRQCRNNKNSPLFPITTSASSSALPLEPGGSSHVGSLHQVVRLRWMSNDSSSSSSPSSTKDAAKAQETQQPTTLKEAVEGTKEEGELSSSSSPAQHVAQQLERGVKRVMELNPGDLYTVVFIASLSFVLLLTPVMVRRVKQTRDNDEESTVFDDFFSADDPIQDMAKLAKTSWGRAPSRDADNENNDNTNDESSTNNTNALEYMLGDVLKSQALQQAAQEFIVQTLESEPVQAALKRLVKELWADLVADPETLAQVVKLLAFAISNPDVQRAAQKLVLDLVEEPDVKQSLVELLQKLGTDPAVQQATQTLLTESAHHALDDADILEHSMEFATDVVGDDIVQRTAGEALRNTVGHAIRPSSSNVLTATGVGLCIFGIIALGYARSSEHEARLLESAARSLKTTASQGILRLLSWPRRALQAILEKSTNTIMWPLQVVREVTIRCSSAILNVLGDGWVRLLALPGQGVHAVWTGLGQVAHGLGSGAHAMWEGLGNGARSVLEGLVWTVRVLSAGATHQVQQLWQAVAAATSRILQTAWASTQAKTQRAQQATSQRLTQLSLLLVTSLTQWARVCQQAWSRQVVRTMDQINDALIQMGLFLEDLIRQAEMQMRRRPKTH